MARDTTAHVAPLGFKVWRMERHNKTATMPAPHAHADIEVNYLSSG